MKEEVTCIRVKTKRVSAKLQILFQNYILLDILVK